MTLHEDELNGENFKRGKRDFFGDLFGTVKDVTRNVASGALGGVQLLSGTAYGVAGSLSNGLNG